MLNFARKTTTFLLIFAIASITFSPNDSTISAAEAPVSANIGQTPQERLEQLERELAENKKFQQDLKVGIEAEKRQINIYSGQVGALSNEVKKLQLDISELELKIQESELNLEIVTERIAAKNEEIATNEGKVLGLQSETDERISTNYMEYRLHKSVARDFFKVKDANTYFKDSQYQELIQEESNRIMQELNNLRLKLDRDKAELEQSEVKVLRDKEILDSQYAQLDRMQSDLETQIAGYYGAIYSSQAGINNTNLQLDQATKDAAKKQAEAELIRQQLFNSIGAINGDYVVAGTIIGYQGSTGWSTGPHLHFFVSMNGVMQNPCGFLGAAGGPIESFDGGCGWGGGLQWPLRGTFYLTSRFYSGYNGDVRCFGGSCYAHPAIDIAHSTWNAPIYAAHDGRICTSVDQYGAIYNVICQNNNCNSGYKTGYWHMSSTLVQARCQ